MQIGFRVLKLEAEVGRYQCNLNFRLKEAEFRHFLSSLVGCHTVRFRRPT